MDDYLTGKQPTQEQAQAFVPIGQAQLQQAERILQEYKNGKTNLEKKIIDNEQWWKLRHWETEQRKISATAWLWNVLNSKHADMVDAYPEPNILPREPNDKEEARMLSAIIPVIMEQNGYYDTYSKTSHYKLKQGASITGVFWDKNKLNGLGDIAIRKIDALNLFWQPGIQDIQDSRNVFQTELVDNDILVGKYPQLKDKLGNGDDIYQARYLYDDAVNTTDKSTVIDWYYKKNIGGKTILHYCKFIGDTVLYSTENDTEMANRGLYDHGEYPFIFDALYLIEGTPFGYGYTDLFKDTQGMIDQLNTAIVKNALMASKRRFFVTDGTEVNVAEFADWENDFVHVGTRMNDETLREINVSGLPGTYVEILNNQIETLKETSGNRDVNNGSTGGSVTAASAIAALQEAGGKTSRDMIQTTYEAYKRIVNQVIELIRQFYDTPRRFRITGNDGTEQFMPYDNRGIRPQPQDSDFGVDMGYRLPVFDIKVSASKATAYSKMSNNELALQFYQLGFFNPSNGTQALAVLDMMDFDGKEDIIQKIEKNGTILTLFQQLYQTAVGMAQMFDPRILPQLQAMGVQAGIIDTTQMIEPINHGRTAEQDRQTAVDRARERAQQSTQPN